MLGLGKRKPHWILFQLLTQVKTMVRATLHTPTPARKKVLLYRRRLNRAGQAGCLAESLLKVANSLLADAC